MVSAENGPLGLMTRRRAWVAQRWPRDRAMRRSPNMHSSTVPRSCSLSALGRSPEPVFRDAAGGNAADVTWSRAGAVLALLVAVVSTACHGDGGARPLALRTDTAIARATDGEVLVVDGGAAIGRAAALPRAALYKAASSSWRDVRIPPFQTPLFDVIVESDQHQVLVAGVPCQRFDVTQDSAAPCGRRGVIGAVLDLRSGRWTAAATIDDPTADIGPIAVGWLGAKAVVRAGEGLFEFDPARPDWTRLPDPPVAATTTCIAHGQLYASRLYQDAFDNSNRPAVSRDADGRFDPLIASAYDANTRQWTPPVRTGAAISPPFVFGSACGPNGVLAFGQDVTSPGKPRILEEFGSARRWLRAGPQEVGPTVFATAMLGDVGFIATGTSVTRVTAHGDWTTKPAAGTPRQIAAVDQHTALVLVQKPQRLQRRTSFQLVTFDS